MVAASHNNVDMLKLLIQYGADPKLEFSNRCSWCTAINSAVTAEAFDTFQYLLNLYKEDTLYMNESFRMAISISDVMFYWLLPSRSKIID
jgi:ankyrin repeat protein